MQPQKQTFDESYYLWCWWDVKQAVHSGMFDSGFSHWQAAGRHEGRCYRVLGDDTVFGARLPPFLRLNQQAEDVLDLAYETYFHHGFTVKTFAGNAVRDRLRQELAPIHHGRIVEIGVFGGANILHWAEGAQSRQCSIVGIDPWELATAQNGVPVTNKTQDVQNFFMQLRFNLQGIVDALGYKHIDLWRGFATPLADRVAAASIDFLYIDGDHGKEGVTESLAAWWPKLKPGCALWGDDFDWPDVRDAVHAFAASKRLDVGTWANQYHLVKPALQ